MVSQKGVAQAIFEISQHFPDQRELNQYLRYVGRRILLPTAMGAVVLGVVFQILAVLHRYWYPSKVAAQMHRQALACWKQDDVKAVQLLEKSLRIDPFYQPSWLALISLHLYHQQNIPAAKTRYLQAVQYCNDGNSAPATTTGVTTTMTTPNSSSITTTPATSSSSALGTKHNNINTRNNQSMTQALRQFQMDILAFEQHLGHMVQTGAFIDEYLQVDSAAGIWQPDITESATQTTYNYLSSKKEFKLE